MFLPAYSPDLNPIEQVVAKLMAMLRRAEPRSRESLWNTIGHSLDRFGPDECRNYLWTSAGQVAVPFWKQKNPL